jgi:hypothetical protein
MAMCGCIGANMPSTPGKNTSYLLSYIVFGVKMNTAALGENFERNVKRAQE